jgi:hypothetical protein
MMWRFSLTTSQLTIARSARGDDPLVAAGPVFQVSAMNTTPVRNSAPRIIPKNMRMCHPLPTVPKQRFDV